jgi:UDPglucose--hexose-1-phosphate uridylyltransferase
MSELRKDYITERWVLVAESRRKRHQLAENKLVPYSDVEYDACCPFCPGNEHMTPPEIMRVGNGERWRIRVFPNKFPAVKEEGHAGERNTEFFKRMNALGKHEVIVESPKHNAHIGDLTVAELVELIDVYIARIDALESVEHIREVNVFKNYGSQAGASLPHTHSQIIGLNKVSERTLEEVRVIETYANSGGPCPYCKLVEQEVLSERVIFDGKHMCAIAPFAPFSAYEVLIVPKEHVTHLRDLNNAQKEELAKVMHAIMGVLKEARWPFCYYLKSAPKGIQHYHFYIRIMPRLDMRAGFEEQTEIIITTVAPETAASHYREKFRELGLLR